MENPGLLVIQIYTYTGVPWSTEYIFIRKFMCPSSPRCTCFVSSSNFTVRCDVASAIVYCARRASKFAVSMNNYARSLHSKAKKIRKSSYCLAHLNLVLHTHLYSQIDYAWDNRLELLSYKWSLLMDAAAWLSTLGGGHSALGEHSSKHAQTAGNLSVKQFRLALELGDKGLEYRCRLYYALSLIQQRQLHKSKTLTRWIYHQAKHNLKDEKLQVMCQGVWSKLRYHYGHLHRSKLVASDKNGAETSVLYKTQSRNR